MLLIHFWECFFDSCSVGACASSCCFALLCWGELEWVSFRLVAGKSFEGGNNWSWAVLCLQRRGIDLSPCPALRPGGAGRGRTAVRAGWRCYKFTEQMGHTNWFYSLVGVNKLNKVLPSVSAVLGPQCISLIPFFNDTAWCLPRAGWHAQVQMSFPPKRWPRGAVAVRHQVRGAGTCRAEAAGMGQCWRGGGCWGYWAGTQIQSAGVCVSLNRL